MMRRARRRVNWFLDQGPIARRPLWLVASQLRGPQALVVAATAAEAPVFAARRKPPRALAALVVVVMVMLSLREKHWSLQ